MFEYQSTIEPIGAEIVPLGDGWEFRGAFIRPGNASPGEFVMRLAVWRRRIGGAS